ncbi:MAG TPA: hypothetical protein VEW07_13315 [Solirubrobacterales bacterium]|nr:hypothetical protein [Solirubrobacterales bacterium]
MGWSRVIEDVLGFHHIELGVDPPGDPYPAMVQIEAEGGTVLAEDARAYALGLLAAAEEADAQNDAAFGAFSATPDQPNCGGGGEVRDDDCPGCLPNTCGGCKTPCSGCNHPECPNRDQAEARFECPGCGRSKPRFGAACLHPDEGTFYAVRVSDAVAEDLPRVSGQCSTCGTTVSLGGDGRVEAHRAPKQLSGVCFGTGKEPTTKDGSGRKGGDRGCR